MGRIAGQACGPMSDPQLIHSANSIQVVTLWGLRAVHRKTMGETAYAQVGPQRGDKSGNCLAVKEVEQIPEQAYIKPGADGKLQ